MREVSGTDLIPASPERVFDFLADPANLPAWQAGIIEARVLTPGPTGIGSKARVVRDLAGQRITVELRVTAYEPPSVLALASAYSGIGVEARLQLAPDEAGTRLVFGMTIKAQNLFMAPVEGIVASAAEKDVVESLARLREHFAAKD